jgi:hypothetical protein
MAVKMIMLVFWLLKYMDLYVDVNILEKHDVAISPDDGD